MNQAISKIVRSHRTANDLSLRQAAAQSGVTASTLSRIERGIGNPDVATMRRLCEWAGVPMELAMEMSAPKPSLGELLAFIETDESLAPEYRGHVQDLFVTVYGVFAKYTREGYVNLLKGVRDK